MLVKGAVPGTGAITVHMLENTEYISVSTVLPPETRTTSPFVGVLMVAQECPDFGEFSGARAVQTSPFRLYLLTPAQGPFAPASQP